MIDRWQRPIGSVLQTQRQVVGKPVAKTSLAHGASLRNAGENRQRNQSTRDQGPERFRSVAQALKHDAHLREAFGFGKGSGPVASLGRFVAAEADLHEQRPQRWGLDRLIENFHIFSLGSVAHLR